MTVPVICPNGHPSDDRDYCSLCGVLIGGTPSVAPATAAPAAATPAPVVAVSSGSASSETASGGTCPHCDTEMDPDNRFCEVCGYDPSTGSLPEGPVPVPATNVDDVVATGADADNGVDKGADIAADTDADRDVDTDVDKAADDADPAAAEAPADPGPAAVDEAGAGSNGNGTTPAAGEAVVAPAAPAPATTSGTWVALVTADRDYYDRNSVTEVQFPLGAPPRTIELPGGAPIAIGRRSRSRGTNPAIDLAGPPEDAAVSHTHASLLPADDGGWELVDHGSTNGTYLNESPHPVAANEALPVATGDRIYVGAWTKITLELRS